MNKRKFMRRVILYPFIYFSAVIAAIFISKFHFYYIYLPLIELIPILIVVAATLVGYCFQRCLTYLRSIRELWPKIVVSVQEAIYYVGPSGWEQYKHETVLKGLSIVIDEVRAVYKNINANKNEIGLYPLESLKEIYEEIDRIGPRSRTTCPIRICLTRKKIIKLYEQLRDPILAELALETPSNVDTPYKH